MSKELKVMKGATFNYKYDPAILKIENYDKLVERAEMVADHYDNLVFKDAELSDITLAHKELNSFIRGLEESRKDVKREYQKPLREFEKKVKKVTEKLNKPLHKIKDARDEILDAQEKGREEALIDHLERKLKGTGIKIDDLEWDPKWTNKGNWTDKLNPRKPLREEIDREISTIQEENKKMIADRKILEKFLEDREMEPEGWMAQLEHREALDIISEISAVEKRRKEKEEQEAEAKQREAENTPATVVEKDEHINRPAAEEKSVTPEKSTPEYKAEADEPQRTEIIAITTTRQKMVLLDQFMRENRISYEPYEPEEPEKEYIEDDLPF